VHRTQVQLTESQVRALKDLAADQNKSVAELIRQAVDILLQRSGKVDREEQKRRAIAAAGRFHSGLADVSTRHDEYLSEAYQNDDIR
jgi:Arc/MetJ-type ribon-helix-helix transcriptional regulator